jgi:hypothetical protein
MDAAPATRRLTVADLDAPPAEPETIQTDGVEMVGGRPAPAHARPVE